jgi:precorrin isomerase
MKFLSLSLDSILSKIESRKRMIEESVSNRQKEIDDNQKIYAEEEADKIVERMIYDGGNVFTYVIRHCAVGTVSKVISILKNKGLRVRNDFPRESITVAIGDYEL